MNQNEKVITAGNEKSSNNLQLFKAVVQLTADAVFVTDNKGKIQYVNQAFEKMSGYSVKEVLGKNMNIFKSGKHTSSHYKKLWTTISGGQTYRGIVANKKKSGRIFYVDHTITPINSEDGSIILYIGIWKDITGRIKNEKRKDDFINIAGHEFKTPITSIKVFNQLLKKRFENEPDIVVAVYLAKMENQINRLTKLIADFLDITKVNNGKLEYKKEFFDFDKLIEEIINDYNAAYSTHKIILQRKTNKTVNADRDRIAQVINNLLTNAVKYSPEENNVEVFLSADDKFVTTKIVDSGVGIPKKEIKNIFNKYYRINAQDNDLIPGIGIGLYLSKEIIKKHGGKIWADSRKGKGSSFYFTLPL